MLFSIRHQALLLEFSMGDRKVRQSAEFSDDPNDSSVVRMRVTPPNEVDGEMPEDAHAIELEFDRQGKWLSERKWPMKLPAWDRRTPEEIARAEEIASVVAARSEEIKASEAQADSEPVDTSEETQPKSKRRR